MDKKFETLTEIYKNSTAFRVTFRHYLSNVKRKKDSTYKLMALSKCEGVLYCLYDFGIIDVDLEIYADNVLARFLG